MKSRPILFKAEMVNAILEGRKTQTRRIVRLPKNCTFINALDGMWTDDNLNHGIWHISELSCPFGKIGQQLWVRETFGTNDYYVIKKTLEYRATTKLSDHHPIKWKPSIFMPRALSRIQLEITDIRVERLNDISEDDARAEGVNWEVTPVPGRAAILNECRNNFQNLWQTINGKGSWRENPWLWVIEFKINPPSEVSDG